MANPNGRTPSPDRTCRKCGSPDLYPRRLLCRSCLYAANEDRRKANLNRYAIRKRAYGAQRYSENKAAHNERISRGEREKRLACIAAYGGKCACCDEDRFEFLALDHINGDGGAQRKQMGQGFKVSRWAFKNSFPPGLRVLCHNCNMAIGIYGYCPHRRLEAASEKSEDRWPDCQ